MTVAPPSADRREEVRVPYTILLSETAACFARLGVPAERARLAAEALCYGDLTGMDSHGVFNLARLYVPLLESGRADPAAEPTTLRDLGACVLVDHRRALGLWAASQAVDLAARRAADHGIGLVTVRGATHFGCAGAHALRAAAQGMIGVVASNCGGQRIARPPHGAAALLGTNPLSVAAPAVEGRPFVLDMSTTVVPTGRVRTAARDGRPAPEGWLTDDTGGPVTDPAAFDRGEAWLGWLGGRPETGAHKGFGLGLTVELLAALLPGAATGPARAALDGDGRPGGTDDDIGLLALAIAPGALRDGFPADARDLFATVLDCPPLPGRDRVRYPGHLEAERAAGRRVSGVPLPASLHAELTGLGLDLPVLEAAR
ncbi:MULTISPECIES: Ldh family oxidoreductase [unclassified Streptomyces]|uniref:Ldh family oxidoreductase n=1 Tax=unclassified Streptomyces TaxID=2593676 RepID=UPI00136C5A98|nr:MULTISPECIES: Ldh family oxidoreductase [unclassified Streptomyces]MCW5249613.1 Ldh family oxidoreductase [Streptomyces sp. SHP 1-2]MYU20744.1 Ldh family oxidoreductase [Streptomyces sp. SID8352]